jgi:glycosyltransferase involved in cell wall biosynthesis
MSRPRVVLFVDIFPPSMGGGATRALCIAQSLSALECDVTVATTSCTYPVGKSVLALRSSKERQNNVEVVRVPSLNLPFKGLLNRILNYLSSSLFLLAMAPKLKKVDLIFSVGMHPFTDLAAYFVKLINPKSRLVIDISDLFPEMSLFRIVNHVINKILLQLSDSITVHNERMKKIFVWRYRYTKEIVVVYNPVDTNVFRPNNLSRRKKEVLSALCGRPLVNSLVVCYFGVFGSTKGLDNILRAAAVLQDGLNDMVFCIIGEGEEKRRLQQLAFNLKNVFLLPKNPWNYPLPRDKIVQIATEADIGLAPLVSTDHLVVYVNLPSKAAEFLSSGVPIFAAKGSFVGHLISEWDAGYEVEFSNIEDVCNILRCAYTHRDELAKKSVNARSLALNVFSLEAVQKSLMTLIQQ